MKVYNFLRELTNRISVGEWQELKLNDPVILKGKEPSLPVSEFNRQQLLRMKSLFVRGAGGLYRLMEVDEEAAYSLERNIKAYLEECMADKPDAHKYIIIVCLYLTFVEKEPMHPMEAVHWVKMAGEDGKEAYYCPYKNDSITCNYCVCKRA